MDAARYVAELRSLREVLVAAQEEQQALEKRLAEARRAGGLPAASAALQRRVEGRRAWQRFAPPALPSSLAHPDTSLTPCVRAALQMETENSKLRYQALQLKRAVQEGDAKLAELQQQQQPAAAAAN